MRSRATSGECTRAPQRPNDRSTFKTRSQSHDGSEPPLRGSPTSSLSHDVTEFSAPTRGKEVATSTEKKSGDAKMADSIWPNGLALSLATTPLPAETVSTTAPLTALTQGHWVQAQCAKYRGRSLTARFHAVRAFFLPRSRSCFLRIQRIR